MVLPIESTTIPLGRLEAGCRFTGGCGAGDPPGTGRFEVHATPAHLGQCRPRRTFSRRATRATASRVTGPASPAATSCLPRPPLQLAFARRRCLRTRHAAQTADGVSPGGAGLPTPLPIGPRQLAFFYLFFSHGRPSAGCGPGVASRSPPRSSPHDPSPTQSRWPGRWGQGASVPGPLWRRPRAPPPPPAASAHVVVNKPPAAGARRFAVGPRAGRGRRCPRPTHFCGGMDHDGGEEEEKGPRGDGER